MLNEKPNLVDENKTFTIKEGVLPVVIVSGLSGINEATWDSGQSLHGSEHPNTAATRTKQRRDEFVRGKQHKFPKNK